MAALAFYTNAPLIALALTIVLTYFYPAVMCGYFLLILLEKSQYEVCDETEEKIARIEGWGGRRGRVCCFGKGFSKGRRISSAAGEGAESESCGLHPIVKDYLPTWALG